MSIDVIKKTFDNSTQYGRTPVYAILKTDYKHLFQAPSTHRWHDTAASDVVYCDAPDIGNGPTPAHFFARKEKIITATCGMKSEKQFSSTLSVAFVISVLWERSSVIAHKKRQAIK